MGALVRAKDWSRTPLGPVERWPQSLHTALSILLDSRFAMYIAWGPEFIQFYNDGYRPILGSTKHPAALGISTRETFAEIWDFIGPMFERVMREGEPTYLVDQLLPLDRFGYVEECYFTFCYSAIRNEAGTPGGVFVTVIEVTERMLGERRLATLRELAASTADEKRSDRVCGIAARVLARSKHDLPFALVHLVGDEHHPSSTESTHDALTLEGWPVDEVLATGRAVMVEDVAVRFPDLPSDPWPEPVRQAVVAPIAAAGQERVAGVFIAGISSRRTFDDDYRGFIDLVTGQIAAAVANARTYEDERRRAEALAELDRAKTTFFSNVSHEFRTPLSLLLGPAEDLLTAPAGALSPEDRERVELIQRNALRLLKLVNSLLDFSRLEAGRLRASYAPVDLSRLTTEIASNFRSAMERAGLRFRVDCRAMSQPAYVDVGMWEKVVLNLLSNAFKFTFEGEVALALSEDHGTAVLRVSDSGVGIPVAELDRVFERFHRVEGTRSRSHEGSGIGLALSQELVRLHGGAISVESELGVGTTFTVRLPLGRAHLPEASTVVSDAAPNASALGAAPFVEEALRWLPDDVLAPSVSSAALEHGEGDLATIAPREEAAVRARILVADDNADMRAYLARLLTPIYDVELAIDGADALERAIADPPDIVLSDVMMPRLDGFGLTRALRAHESTADVSIVLLSARAGEESTVEGLATGADDYLVKPFAARELVARLRTHLTLARIRRESRQEVSAANRALELERGRLAEVFRLAPAFIAVLRGPEHVFELVNPAYESMVGNRSLIGRAAREAIPEIEGQGFFELLDRVYTTGEPFLANEAPVRLVIDGREEQLYLNFVYQALRNADGRIDGIFAHGFDVTPQVLARQQVEALLESVREANAAKSQFLSMMSHELRTPLNAILGFADLLELGARGALAPAQLSDVRRIRSAGMFLLGIITDILNFARVESGQMEFRVGSVRVADAIDAACELIRVRADEKSLCLERAIERETGAVYADPERLRQVLVNLLTNAVKFTPTGGTIRVRAERRDVTIAIHVSDTGPGIEPAEAERIFEPFVQVKRDVSLGSQQGVGLGLAISRDLARAMGGDLTLTSRPGEGATFTVILPIDTTA